MRLNQQASGHVLQELGWQLCDLQLEVMVSKRV